VLHIPSVSVKKQRNNPQKINKEKANLIGHVLCRNCLLEQVIEGKIKGGIEVTGRRRRKLGRKLLDDLNTLRTKLKKVGDTDI
jgi:hypothetical protein